MRTTLSLEDALLNKAKSVSRQRKCSVGEVIEEALRQTLLPVSKKQGASPPKPLKTFRGTGVLPGVDLVSSVSLLDSMEDR
jgi:hypothetical protein